MKTTLLAALIGMTFSTALFAGRVLQNNQQKDDVLHCYGQTQASPARAPEMEGEFKNQEQREDLIHGYGVTKASKSEPAKIRVGRSNNQQKEDIVHGYAN